MAGPLLSPNGKRIAFSSPRGIGIIGIDGHLETLIKDTRPCFAGGWVSDDLIVASCGSGTDWPPGPVTGTWSVITVSIDGKTRRTIGTTDPGSPPSACAATGVVAFGRGANTYVVHRTGGSARLLVRGTGNVNWSADGNRIVFADTDAAGKRRIRVANGTAGAARTVATLEYWSGDLSVAFSADARFIVYSGSADTTHDVWSVSVAGGQPARLTTTGDFGDPAPL